MTFGKLSVRNRGPRRRPARYRGRRRAVPASQMMVSWCPPLPTIPARFLPKSKGLYIGVDNPPPDPYIYSRLKEAEPWHIRHLEKLTATASRSYSLPICSPMRKLPVLGLRAKYGRADAIARAVGASELKKPVIRKCRTGAQIADPISRSRPEPSWKARRFRSASGRSRSTYT